MTNLVPHEAPLAAPRAATLAALFQARSIAIIGASNNPRKASYQVIYTLQSEGYTGAVYPVNPNEAEVLGLPCFASVTDIPAPVDLVVLSLPAEAVVAAMRQAASRKDVRGAVILSAGCRARRICFIFYDRIQTATGAA